MFAGVLHYTNMFYNMFVGVGGMLVARPEPNILTCQDVGLSEKLLYNTFAAGQLLYNKVRWWQTSSELCCTTLLYNMLYNKDRLVEYGHKSAKFT